ncbi:FtsK/SpoIIIE domain-containing protein [Oceanobacillus sp. FSL K6-2867]|uniref:FtsK/SpoIIIE domain-containing protein n=1 Tax=Oceanobacillus sp. FSL K6-2867 TaxID=2954748 RepID=UPI0030D6F9AD
MLEILFIPLAIVGASLIPKRKMNDENKIMEIFKSKNICVKRGENVIYPKKIRISEGIGVKTYSYSLPLGIAANQIEPIKEAFENGLNKDIDIKFNGLLHLVVAQNKLPTKWDYSMGLLNENTWEVPIGKNHDGVLYHDFEKYPHMLIGGTTRFGKTVLLKGIFNTLVTNQFENVNLYILDLKAGLEFYKYSGLEQVKKVACDLMEASEVLESVVTELKKREVFYRENGITNVVETSIQKRTFIIVDEGAELSPELVSKEAKPYAQYCQNLLGEIARIGGGLGYRLVFCTQYPVRQAVPAQVKMNIVTRISFLVPEQVGSRVILDEVGAEDLPAIAGRCIYKVEKKRILQTPFIDDGMIKNFIGGAINGENRRVVNDNRQIENDNY